MSLSKPYPISHIPYSKKGFTLIEALAFLFIFSTVTTALYQAYAIGTRAVVESKNRLGATALANQKMEIIRSLPYASIGTKRLEGGSWQYGVPPGDILEDEDISVNTTAYHVHTRVSYTDNAFDGTYSDATDSIPNDQKLVLLEVSWGGNGPDQTVISYAAFSPKGIETPAGGGILSINILDSAGLGVSGATVHIENPAASVNMTTSTNADGNITLIGTPAGTEAYQLTVSKSGYYGATTYPPYPSSAYHPTDVHASVVEGVMTQKTMAMDQASDIRISTVDPFGTPVPNVSFHVEGGRVMGSAAADLTTVYSLASDVSTDGSGRLEISGQSYGPYEVDAVTKSGYAFLKLYPDGPDTASFEVSAGVNKDMSAIMLDEAVGSLLVAVKDVNGLPVSGAAVRLTEGASSYDATVTSDAFGYAYFPTALPGLAAGTYGLEVSASGFDTETDTVSVSGASLVTESVTMQPS